MRIALVAVANEATQYVAPFIAYHERLFDHLFIVDHNTSRDRSNCTVERVSFFRASYLTFFQEEFTNILIDKTGLRSGFDWIFVLDVDEFLPFPSRARFEQFLKEHRNSPIVELNWLNGAPLKSSGQNAATIADNDSIQFFSEMSPTVKAAINVRVTAGNFYVKRSSHQILRRQLPWFMQLPILRRSRVYRSRQKRREVLYHVVSASRENFTEKVLNYKRMVSLQKSVPKLGGRMIAGYPEEIDSEQWRWYVANYRQGDPAKHYSPRDEDFVDVTLFGNGLRSRAGVLREELESAPRAETVTMLSGVESDFLSFKSHGNKFHDNIKWFDVDGSRIVIRPPLLPTQNR